MQREPAESPEQFLPFAGERRAPDRHDAVADELVHDAPVQHHVACLALAEHSDRVGQHLRVLRPLAHRREPGDVDEQDRALALLHPHVAELVPVQQLLDNGFGHVARKVANRAQQAFVRCLKRREFLDGARRSLRRVA